MILKRLSGRRFCPNCKASFHIDFMPSSKGNICDKCGTPLITRKDDSPESIKNRLMVYKEQTGPLLDYYKNKVYVFEANNDPKALADLIVNSLTK
nr:nucleoside monophosphate kinase [Mycoplasmopsis bovis]